MAASRQMRTCLAPALRSSHAPTGLSASASAACWIAIWGALAAGCAPAARQASSGSGMIRRMRAARPGSSAGPRACPRSPRADLDRHDFGRRADGWRRQGERAQSEADGQGDPAELRRVGNSGMRSGFPVTIAPLIYFWFLNES